MNFSIPRKSIFWVEKRQTADAAENPTEMSHLESNSPGLGPDTPSLARLDHNSRTDQSLLSKTDQSGSKSLFDNLSSTTRNDLRRSPVGASSRISADAFKKGPRIPQTVKDLDGQTSALNESFKKRELRRPSTLNVRKPYMLNLYDQRITEEEKESFRSYSASEDSHSNYESSVAYETSAYGEEESDNTSDDDEENMDPMRQLVRRRLRKFFYASYFVGIAVSLQNRIRLYGTLKTIEKIPEPHQPEFTKLTINRFLPLMPSDNIRCMWTLILAFFTFMMVILTPYQVSFIDIEDVTFRSINIIFDIVFGIDIIMNFISAYYVPEHGLITDVKTISYSYIKSWFLVDLAAMFPITAIVSTSATNFERVNKLLRLSYSIRLRRWFKLFRLFKMLKLFSTSKSFNRLIKRFNTNTGLIKMLEFVLNITILNHFVGCIWYFLAKMYDFDPDTWVTRFGFIDADSFTHYLISYSWALQTITTVGFGDIEPGTPIERVIAILWMIMGVGVYSFTIGNLSSILVNMDRKETSLKTKISIFNNFASQVKVPEFLRRKVQRFYELNHKENAFYWLEPYDMLKHLPESLKATLLLYSYHSMTKNIEILEMNANFTAAILIHLKLIKLEKREILYREGDPSQEIYFISKGSVKMVNQVNQGIYTLVTGTYFGEIEIMQDLKRLCFAQACESTIVIVCDKTIFLETLKSFPDVESKLKKVAQYREDKIKARLAQLKEELANMGENVPKANRKPLANSIKYYHNILLNQQPKMKKNLFSLQPSVSSDDERRPSKQRKKFYYSQSKTPPNETTHETSLQKLSDLAKVLRKQKSDEKVKDDKGGKVRVFKKSGIKVGSQFDLGPPEEKRERKPKKNSPNVSFVDIEKKGDDADEEEVKVEQDTVKVTEPNSLQITPMTSEGITILKNRIEDDSPKEAEKKVDLDLANANADAKAYSPGSNMNTYSLEGMQLKVSSSDFTKAFQQFVGGNKNLSRFGSSSKEVDKLEYVKRVQEGLGEIRKLREITETILSQNDFKKESVIAEFSLIAERQKTLNVNVEKLFSLLRKTN